MLAQRLEEIRKARGLSREQLAAAAGTSKKSIDNYEQGRRQPPADILAALADALDVSADYLLGRTASAQPLRYGGIDPGRIEDVAGLCDRVLDLAAADAAADYERNALPVYVSILDELRALVADTDTIYAQIRDAYPAFTACSMTDDERAALLAAELSNDPAAIERKAGDRAFDTKLQNRIDKAGNKIYSLLSVSLYNILRAKIGADVPQLRHVVTTGTDPDSSGQ